MPENPTNNDKQVLEYKIGEYLKSEKITKWNLPNQNTVLMALCDTKVKNQVKTLPEY